ncbi:alpha/beta hydrolase [Clostridium sp. AL.422]|uniref:alpha/beta fold hydrolase n=1 Tax=Clostridium TaxID=1485 RepID=UPI00293DFBA8|nr:MULTISPECIES: alpha/beta hydrolase [unclassified Clostridium]MDV4149526.1 alpha/beta hydrolase [Clostridium sp. AL.422]
MKLLPHSNGLYKVNMKIQLNPKDRAKKIILIILIVLSVGFIFQRVSNFITKETLKERVDYVRVNDKRLDFKLDGEGKYTIIFDGNIGTNLNQWNEISEKLVSDYGDVVTFTYNRRGYGFSDSGSIRTPKEQAEDLRLLLKKAGVPAPYILVGEEYGSLVLTEFTKAYPDLVAGIVLVNPLVEDEINTDQYKRSMFFDKFRRNVEKIGSEIGLTTLLDKINLACSTDEFENKLDENALEEFKAHRTKASYNKAVSNENKNITSGNNFSQEDGVFSGKPYYLIAKPGQEVLSNLGDEDLTKVYNVDYEESIVSMYEPDTVITGIRQVIKQANEIERLQKNN